METQNKLRVEKGAKFEGTKLIVNHNNKDLAFLHPGYGANTYSDVKEQIEKDNLKPATMAKTASLVHAAFNSNDEYSEEIREIMQRDSLWAYTGLLYTPKGVYIKDNPEIRNGMPFMEESNLVIRLKMMQVRFVPFGYEIGEMSSLKLSKNFLVIALVGKEGAEKLAEVADKFRSKTFLYALTKDVIDRVDQQMITRVSSLNCYQDITNRLCIDANNDGGPGGRYAHAFGII